MTGLQIAPDLSLPEAAVTETFGILAKRGSGKTYTAGVLVEEMLTARLPVCVVDPLGVWWGLRSSADGKSAGEPVVIFGGDHADIPLQDTAGELIADVVISERIPAVLDLSDFTKAAARRFMTDFAERLYHRNREPLHLVVDEADAFAPQRAQHGAERLLGAMEDIVRRGRSRGIGCTMISQRPAVLNKDVLTQIEVLIVGRMTGPRDVAAIDEWVRLHATDEEAKAVKASLPSLPIGTAWVWSPGWLDVLQKIEVRKKRTFDSSATPTAGQTRPAPKRMADIDLGKLGERIVATVEQAKADDPKALHARIRDLERQLKAERDMVPAGIVEEVPALTDDERALVERVIEQWDDAYDQATLTVNLLRDALARIGTPAAAKVGGASQRRSSAAKQSPTPGERLTPGTAKREIDPAGARETRPNAPAGLGKAERSILAVLAQHGARTKVQVAILTGYSHRGGGFGNALGALRSAGLIAGRETLEITQDGIDAVGYVEPLPTGRDLVEHWQTRLGKAERGILDTLVQAWPAALTKEQIADATGYASTGGGFNNALGRLRGLELIEGRAEITASAMLAA